jgi:glycolate oxidase FAD binding subunit
LGFRAVNGLGEAFRGGAKVVKNVTGFDLPKLMCGAYGTLGVLTEMTFRVYPQPQFATTLCLSDVTP